MKATGVVRRIDDLGRVVIPKEIRRTMRIREGDSLEIFVNQSGEVVLKKYSPIADISAFAQQYADAMQASTKKGKEVLEIVDGETTERSFVMIPIISNGDSLGAVILVGTEEDELVNELDINSVKIATAFLGKYLEG